MESLLTSQKISLDSYLWIDMEMTGLNIEKDLILEIACIITKPDLVPVHEGIHLIFHHSDEVLSSMDTWCLTQHEKSGLLEASRNSKIKVSEGDIILSDYIRQHTNPKGLNYVTGNSVCMDKLFLKKHMPLTDGMTHYRIIDVSSIKILCQHWYPTDYTNLPRKQFLHRALNDIKESLEELKYYRSAIFRQTDI